MLILKLILKIKYLTTIYNIWTYGVQNNFTKINYMQESICCIFSLLKLGNEIRLN